jgi:hypothetical protein
MTARSLESLDRTWDGQWNRLTRMTVQTGVLLSAAVAIVMVWRRWAGVWVHPLPTTTLLGLGLLLLALSAAGLLGGGASRTAKPRIPTRARFVWQVMASLAIGSLAWAVSAPGTPRATLGGFWLLVIGGELLRWLGPPRVFLPVCHSATTPFAASPHSPGLDSGLAQDAESMADGCAEDELEQDTMDLLPPEVSQRILRARGEQGCELIHGTIQCDFRGGQRQQNVHLAFCPPLATIPDLSADQLAGPPVQIRPTLVESFGAVLELKLSSPSRQPERVQLQFYASERPTEAGVV